jgi:hypothetical protein
MPLFSWLAGKRPKASGGDAGSFAEAYLKVGLPRLLQSFEHQREFLRYLADLDAGGAVDPAYEALSLNHDLLFTTYNFAEILYALAVNHGLPAERVADFFEIGIYEGGDPEIGMLLRRIDGLAESFGLEDRGRLLDSGVVGDRAEIKPVGDDFDTVGHMLKFCRVVQSLGHQEGHAGVDVASVQIEADDGWAD